MVQTEGSRIQLVGFAHTGSTLNLLTNQPNIQFETDTHAKTETPTKESLF